MLAAAHAVHATLARCVGLDRRSLALFRITFCVQLLCKWSLWWSFMPDMLDDAGLMPRSQLLDRETWSLHLVSGHILYLRLIASAQLIALACLLAGFRTRAATVVAYVLQVSLYRRTDQFNGNSFVGPLETALLFWSCWLPCIARETSRHK